MKSHQHGETATRQLSTAVRAAGCLPLPLTEFRETNSSAVVGNIAANGGVLASDTTPILGASAKSLRITWVAGDADPVAIQRPVPQDFDGSEDVTLRMWVASGSTDAASFTVESMWDGAAAVSDSVDDSTSKSATVHEVTATIAASDIPDGADYVTVLLTPPAHAADAIVLVNARLEYKASVYLT